MKRLSKTNKWGLTIENTTAWSSGVPGTAITPGASNVYGSYTQLINGSTAWATDSGDAFLVEILIVGSGVSSAAKDTLITLGIDLAGGTTYTTWIDSLIAGPASDLSTAAGGCWYTFPIRVPRGASIAAKVQVNNATAGTVSVAIRLRCRPTVPEVIRWGSYVRTFGASTATSAGTAVTPGATNVKGSWVQLGSAIAAGDNLWWWQVGVGLNQATANNNASCADLGIGDATNKDIVIRDVPCGTTTAEMLTRARHDGPAVAKVGDLVYGRMAAAATPLTGWSMSAYAVGG